MNSFFVRLWLLNKRLLKKPSFICILILSLTFVVWLSASVPTGGSMLTVAAASEEPDEKTYIEILSDLKNGAMINILEMSCEDAVKAVESGKADAAWIFPADLDKRFSCFVNDVNEDNYVVSVIQREESVLLHISREKLMSALYPRLSYSMFSEFMKMRYPSLESADDSVFRERYDSIDAEVGELFRIVTPQGISVNTDRGVLLSPIRGILAILVVVGGLAASLYSIRDERDGCFDMLPESRRIGIYILYNTVAVLDIALVAVISLALSGLSSSVGREIVLLLVLVFSSVAFCTFLRVLFSSERLFGAFIPLIAILLITLCPVFINVSAPLWLKLLLPPYGYLSGMYSYSSVLAVIGVSFIYIIAALIVYSVRSKRNPVFLKRSR